MKKLVIALLCLTLLCTLFACSSPQDAAAPNSGNDASENPADSGTDTADQGDTAVPADSDIVIGFANLTDTLDYGKTVKAGVLAAAEERGWEVIALDNERTGSKAVENATTLVTRGVDAIIEFNVDAAVAPTIMEIVNNADIPIICIDIPTRVLRTTVLITMVPVMSMARPWLQRPKRNGAAKWIWSSWWKTPRPARTSSCA